MNEDTLFLLIGRLYVASATRDTEIQRLRNEVEELRRAQPAGRRDDEPDLMETANAGTD